MTRARSVFLIACTALALAACHFKDPEDGQRAVDQAFARFGPAVVAQAHRVAQCESGYRHHAQNGWYRGIFQLGNHVIAINNYGGDFFNPFSNAMAAAERYDAQVGSKTDNVGSWSGWSCRP